MSMNNESIGPIQAKTGPNNLAINRFDAYPRTMGELHDSTKSGHQHVDKHYSYEELGDLTGSLIQASAYDGPKQPKGTY